MSRRAKATTLVSIALFGALLSSVFAEPAFWFGAFGPTAYGVPTTVFVGIVVAGLYGPVPWFAWHAMGIVLRGRDLGMSLGKLGVLHMLLTLGRRYPELRRSQMVVAGAALYFLVLVAGWICFAESRGL